MGRNQLGAVNTGRHERKRLQYIKRNKKFLKILDGSRK